MTSVKAASHLAASESGSCSVQFTSTCFCVHVQSKSKYGKKRSLAPLGCERKLSKEAENAFSVVSCIVGNVGANF